MRRLRFTRQEGMLGVLFYPRDFGQSPTERLAIPQSGGLETSLHARPHMCDHQFFHQRGTRRGLTGWTREGSSALLVLGFGLSEGVLRVPQISVQARAASSVLAWLRRVHV